MGPDQVPVVQHLTKLLAYDVKISIFKYGKYIIFFAAKMWVAFALHCIVSCVVINELVKQTMLWTTGSCILVTSQFACKYMNKKTIRPMGYMKAANAPAQSIALTFLLLNTTCPVLANSVDPDQLASEEAKWSGSALFVIKYVNFYQKPSSSNLIAWKLEVGVAS